MMKLLKPKEVEAPQIEILYQDDKESHIDLDCLFCLLFGIIIGLLIDKLF